MFLKGTHSQKLSNSVLGWSFVKAEKNLGLTHNIFYKKPALQTGHFGFKVSRKVYERYHPPALWEM